VDVSSLVAAADAILQLDCVATTIYRDGIVRGSETVAIVFLEPIFLFVSFLPVSVLSHLKRFDNRITKHILSACCERRSIRCKLDF
jgi:hypothetical protein